MTTTQTTFDGLLDEAINTTLDTQAMIDEDNAPMIDGCVAQLKDLDYEMLRNLGDDDYELTMLYTIIHNAIQSAIIVAKGYIRDRDVHTAIDICANQRFIMLTAQRMLRK